MAAPARYITPARDLAKETQEKECIIEYVKEILSNINEDVERAKELKEDKAVTEVPVLFDIPGLKNVDAQKRIYFEVLRALEKNSYQPHITFLGREATTQKVFIKVTWRTVEEKNMDKHMDEYIRQRSNYAAVPKEVKTVKPISRRRRPKKIE